MKGEACADIEASCAGSATQAFGSFQKPEAVGVNPKPMIPYRRQNTTPKVWNLLSDRLAFLAGELVSLSTCYPCEAYSWTLS